MGMVILARCWQMCCANLKFKEALRYPLELGLAETWIVNTARRVVDGPALPPPTRIINHQHQLVNRNAFLALYAQSPQHSVSGRRHQTVSGLNIRIAAAKP